VPGPAGSTDETHWGVLVAKGASVTVATAGPFTLQANCQSSGLGQYILTTSADGAWVVGEDGPYPPAQLNTGQQDIPASDEDYDEAFNAWSPSTGVSINAFPYTWNVGHGNANECFFQGELFKTS
jgi:hypothetical protein